MQAIAERQFVKKRFYAVVLSMLMIVSVFAGISLADEEPSANEKTLFTLHRVDGATQYEVTAGGEQRVIYCMEYDHLWPTTEDGTRLKAVRQPNTDKEKCSKGHKLSKKVILKNACGIYNGFILIYRRSAP